YRKMEVKIFNKDYIQSNAFYTDFKKNTLNFNATSEQEIIDDIELIPFPIYLSTHSESERTRMYIEAFNTLKNYYFNLDFDILMKHEFWISLFSTHFRDYLITNYPEIMINEQKFNHVLLKRFDWENYIYKCILMTQFIVDGVIEDEQIKYVTLVSENLDLYNYLLKYPLFRQQKFVLD